MTRRTPGLCRKLVVSVKNPTRILCTELEKHPQRTRNERVGVCHDMSGSFFLVADEDPYGVLHGDYKFST